jgi:hypothetical protein
VASSYCEPHLGDDIHTVDQPAYGIDFEVYVDVEAEEDGVEDEDDGVQVQVNNDDEILAIRRILAWVLHFSIM